MPLVLHLLDDAEAMNRDSRPTRKGSAYIATLSIAEDGVDEDEPEITAHVRKGRKRPTPQSNTPSKKSRFDKGDPCEVCMRYGHTGDNCYCIQPPAHLPSRKPFPPVQERVNRRLKEHSALATKYRKNNY
ncbi:MAG: hypothetical protein SEPTF4163_000389 [Sporothrix epigloea]